MGPAPRHGHGLVLFQRRAGHVQPLIKAMNAGTVEPVGIETHQILLMVNTNPPRRAAFCRASKCPIDKSSKRQAPSLKLQAPRQYVTLTQDVVVRRYVILTEAPSDKLQAPSNKPQASSPKLQAPGSVNHGTWILEKFLMPKDRGPRL